MNPEDIRHETADYFVLAVGERGYEVMRKYVTHSKRVACIGHGPGPSLGLERAISEADRRQVQEKTSGAAT